jgi:hypothetical protein
MENIKLILIGGAEDKTDKLEILSKVAQAADYKNIVLIPTASSYPHEAEVNYTRAFEKLNVENFKTLDIRYPDECDRVEHFDIIEQANLVFFSGGDQVKLVDTLKDSQLIKRIKETRIGKLNIYEFFSRMGGEGEIANAIHKLFKASCAKYGLNKTKIHLTIKHFTHNPLCLQEELF